MLLKNNSKNNGNMFQQFQQFRSNLQSSGKNPHQMLNDLVSSGQVSKSQLENATRMAKMFSYLLK